MAQGRVAVVYATRGGMGDVGKFAAAQLLEQGTPTKVIALSARGEGEDKGFSVDVTDEQLQKGVAQTLEKADGDIVKMSVDDPQCREKLAAELSGATAVVACVGNRQPPMSKTLFGLAAYPERWCERGAIAVTGAMQDASIGRLVLLSSFGLGREVGVKFGFVKLFWGLLLSTAFRSAKKDLVRMEGAVTGTPGTLDYLLVRAVGLTPEEAPKGTTKVVHKRSDGFVHLSVAKKDMAEFMIQEAVQPTLHRTHCVVGHPPPGRS